MALHTLYLGRLLLTTPLSHGILLLFSHTPLKGLTCLEGTCELLLRMCPEVRLCLFLSFVVFHSLPSTFFIMSSSLEHNALGLSPTFSLWPLNYLKFSGINLVPATRHCTLLCQVSHRGLPPRPIPPPCLFEGCPLKETLGTRASPSAGVPFSLHLSISSHV